MSLTVVILTKDEEIHIERALASVADIADRCVVVDSGSTDCTVERARATGAEVIVHPFVTQARQFNWALEMLPEDTDWVLRLDADEIVSPELAKSIADTLPSLSREVAGAEVMRRMAFLGRPIRWGGLFPLPVLRLLRHGRGRSEDRWMDEHIRVEGKIVRLNGEVLDDNRKSLGWWIEKHNNYAAREVVEILDAEYHFLARGEQTGRQTSTTGIKRWLKENVYIRMPSGLRAFIYFFYRYVLRLGVLDGREGTAFHVLQGYWYRYLIDIKLYEVKKYIRENDASPESAVLNVLGIDIRPSR